MIGFSPGGARRVLSRRAVHIGGALVAIGIALTVLIQVQPPSSAAVRPGDELKNVRSFALSLGALPSGAADMRRLARHDLVVIDGNDATSEMIGALQRQGVTVLGYLSVGTIEPWRPWYGSLKKYRGAFWSDWGEWYADVADPGFRREIARVIAPAILDKGFNGLFLDNTDMVERYRAQAAPMRVLVRELAALSRRRETLLFAQNGDPQRQGLLRYLDGWNREDVTSTYDGDLRRYVRLPAGEQSRALADVRRLAKRGLFVTTTDYIGARDTTTRRLAIAAACAAGAVPYVADIALKNIPATPIRCRPGG